MSIDAHLSAYAQESSDDLPFRAAMMFSGQVSWGILGVLPAQDAYTSWNNLSLAVGCPSEEGEDQLECMKTANATEITEQMGNLGIAFGPLRDNNVTVPSNTAARWREGNVARVPLLTGTVAQEGRALVNNNISLDLFLSLFFFDPLVTQEQRDALVAYYSTLPGVEDDFDLAAALYTDFAWQCVSSPRPPSSWKVS